MNRGFGNQGFEDTALGDELDADFAARNVIEVPPAHNGRFNAVTAIARRVPLPRGRGRATGTAAPS